MFRFIGDGSGVITRAQFEKVIWSDPGVDWSGYDRVIPKAVWDYFNRPEEFKAYLEEMKQS